MSCTKSLVMRRWPLAPRIPARSRIASHAPSFRPTSTQGSTTFSDWTRLPSFSATPPFRQMQVVSVPLSSTRTSSFFHDVLTRDTFPVQPAHLRYSSQHLHFYFGGIGRIGPGLDLGAFNEQCMSGLHITAYSIHIALPLTHRPALLHSFPWK